MPETLNGRQRILNYLADNDISQAQLATMYGMNKQDVSDYLSGRKTNPAANKFIITLIKNFGIKYERKQINLDKNEYLKQFERQNPVVGIFGEKSKIVGEQLVQVMKKEGITYDQAYASLQYAYNKIRFESNFLKLQ